MAEPHQEEVDMLTRRRSERRSALAEVQRRCGAITATAPTGKKSTRDKSSGKNHNHTQDKDKDTVTSDATTTEAFAFMDKVRSSHEKDFAELDEKQRLTENAESLRRFVRQLREVDAAIEDRMHAIQLFEGTQINQTGVSYWSNLHEMLEEDMFWKAEIEKRVSEHEDEQLACQLLLREKARLAQRSADTALSRKDEAQAKALLELELEFETATRRQIDNDEHSIALAKQLQEEFNKEMEGKQHEESDSNKSRKGSLSGQAVLSVVKGLLSRMKSSKQHKQLKK